MVTLGRQIKAIRTLRNMKQGELAETIGICQPTLCTYENDKATPSLETLEAIRAALSWPSDGQARVAFAILAGDGTEFEALTEGLDIAIAALRQYAEGKTWKHIAVDALEELEERGLIGGSHGKSNSNNNPLLLE